jgi:hypothetical protein
MIESPTSTAIIETAPPAYADEPDSPLEKKESMLPSEAAADQDIEITVINHKPITANIRASATSTLLVASLADGGVLVSAWPTTCFTLF